MKNVFLVNAAAGNKKKNKSLLTRIHNVAEKMEQEYFIYRTKHKGDAESFIREECITHPETKFRFFGCGGDGTLNEVINGAYGFENAVVGNIPIGTGNDFIRYFGKLTDFYRIDSQLMGRSVSIDLLRCRFSEGGEAKERYCDNMINIGFDSNVVAQAETLKKKGIASGSRAYALGVAMMLMKKKGADLRIEADGECLHDGPLLLTAVANGRYCGGGVKSSPESNIFDGMVEVSIIKDISRRYFVSLYPKYAKGAHFEDTLKKNVLIYRRARKIKIKSNREPMKVSLDGEIHNTYEISLEIVPAAVNFCIPAHLPE